MKITVIGGRGFIGARLVSSLKVQGNEVHSASSSNDTGIASSTGLLPEDFEFLKGTQAVVYLAQSPHFRAMPDQASHLLAVNCLSVVRAAVAAKRAGITRFVYVSTGTVYAPSFSPLPETAALNRNNWYALSKIHGEESIQLFRNDFEIVVCRPFAIYGEGQEGRLIPNLIRSVRQNQPITLQPASPGLSDGGLLLSLCHVDDAIHALSNMVQYGNVSVVNLAGAEHLSVAEIAYCIGRKIGLEPNLIQADTLREGNLVSAPRVFMNFYKQKLIPFEAGLDRMLAHPH